MKRRLLCHFFYLIPFFVRAATEQCTPIIWHPSGVVDIARTLYNCSDNMPSALSPNSYNTGNYISVNSSINLNNLVSISEIDGSATLDFYWRMLWVDERWDISDLWSNVPVGLSGEGIELVNMIQNSNSALNIWMPDLFLQDATQMEVLSETVKLRPNGVIYWSRHVVATLAQTTFDYSKYPLDDQHVEIRYYSYSMTTTFLRQFLRNPAVTYIVENSEINFGMNSVWSHEVNDYEAYVYAADQSQGSLKRYFDVVVVKMHVIRRSDGILIRLALPILILMVLGGLTFWAAPDARVDSTMTILLAISALYIVVFSSIPMIGYLTTFDKFTVVMFFLLTTCAAIHQGVNRVIHKAGSWPLRQFLVRAVEFGGRLIIIPFSVIYFGTMFSNDFISKSTTAAVLAVLLVLLSILTIREIGGLKKTYIAAMMDIKTKADNPSSARLSKIEEVLFSLYFRFSHEQYKRRNTSRKSGSAVEMMSTGDKGGEINSKIISSTSNAIVESRDSDDET
jgi:hypothetical protein